MTGTPTREAPAASAPVSAGGLSVRTTGATLRAAAAPVLEQARADGLAAALAARDATLWGPEGTAEASARLGWLDAVARSRPLVDEVVRLRDALRSEGVDRVLLCGMGGSSLAPEVVCAAAGVPLDLLDSTHPAQVRSALR